MGKGGPQSFAALSEADPWAPVSMDGLPVALVAAVESEDWVATKRELEQVMDGLSTDGPYGRALLQLVRRLPIGLDSVFDRYRAAVSIDHGHWDDLRRCLDSAPYAARELVQFREALLAPVSRTIGLIPRSIMDSPFLAYDLQLAGRWNWFRHWTKRLPDADAASRWSRPDVPVGRHLRYRALHHALLRAVGEAHGGSLPLATALATEATRFGDDQEPLRDIASDLRTLTVAAMGDAISDRPLALATRTPGPNGMSPLGTLEWLIYLMPFLGLMKSGWLGASAGLMQRIANRLGSPKAQLQADAWLVAAEFEEGSKPPRRSGLPAVLANARTAVPGLRVLPAYLEAWKSERYTAFQRVEEQSRVVGNVWMQVASLTWMVAIDPSPRVGLRLLRLLRVSGWRRPVLVPEPILSDAVLGMLSVGVRDQALIEMALTAGRPTTAAEVAARHATDGSLSVALRLAGVEALSAIGTSHARHLLSGLMHQPEEVGRAARASIRRGPRGVHLTGREVEVLDLAGRGLTNRRIADQLTLSQHTVARHLSNARDKLGAVNRAEAAVRLGQLSLEMDGQLSTKAAGGPGRRPNQVSIPYRAATASKVPAR